MSNWRNILSYRTNTEFKPGARVAIDLTNKQTRWTRPEYPEGSEGTIVAGYLDVDESAWCVVMDNGRLDPDTRTYPSFYQRDLKLI